MPILIIGEVERRKIAVVKERALKRPVRMSDDDLMALMELKDKIELTLEDRSRMKAAWIRSPSAQVIFPGGYRAAFSYEIQPAGLCAHLSVSVMGREKKGMMPLPESVAMIASEFGMAFPADKMWTEEFEPGEYAINLVCVTAPAQQGRA